MSSKSRERFVILAEKRVNRAIKDIKLIGNLSNRSNYSYTDGEADKILKALESELKNLKFLFKRKNGSEKAGFRLADE